MNHHPIVDTWPVLDPAQFDALRDSIKTHGQQVPALVWRGQLVDGAHRARACAELGANLRTEELIGPEVEMLELVCSVNNHRRHMSAEQRARAVLRNKELRDRVDAMAKEAQAHGSTAPGVTLSDNCPKALPMHRDATLARIANVDERTIRRTAHKMRREADADAPPLKRLPKPAKGEAHADPAIAARDTKIVAELATGANVDAVVAALGVTGAMVAGAKKRAGLSRSRRAIDSIVSDVRATALQLVDLRRLPTGQKILEEADAAATQALVEQLAALRSAVIALESYMKKREHNENDQRKEDVQNTTDE